MPYATYRFNKIIAAETIRFIVTVAIVVYKGLKLVVYRMLTMYGGVSGNELDTLEVVFHRDRDKTVIRNIRNEVEDFEYRTRVRAEKLERARLLQQEAEKLIFAK